MTAAGGVASGVPKGYKQTEVGVIPDDWSIISLIEASRQITDGEHLTPKRTTFGYYLLSARNIQNGSIDLSDVDFVDEEEYQRLQKRCCPHSGDVLISCSGSIGRIAIVPDGLKCVMVRSAALIKTNRLILNGVFLQYFLQSNYGQWQIFTSVNQGAQANLFNNHIQKIVTILPPLPEQHAIAAALSDTDTLIDSLERLIAKKRLIKQGAMQQLLTGKKRLPGFAGEWVMVRLADTGKCYRGVSYNPNRDLYPTDTVSTCRLLRSNNVQGSKIITCDMQYVHSDVVSSHQKLKKYDVLICMANGSRDLVGKAGLFLIDDEYDYTFGAFMGCFRPDGLTTDICYVYYMFQTEEYRKHISILLSGSSINNLNPSSLEALVISVPSTKVEQSAIASVLSDMDTEIDSLESRLAKTLEIKQGMMQQLLTGRVRLV